MTTNPTNINMFFFYLFVSSRKKKWIQDIILWQQYESYAHLESIQSDLNILPHGLVDIILQQNTLQANLGQLDVQKPREKIE